MQPPTPVATTATVSASGANRARGVMASLSLLRGGRARRIGARSARASFLVELHGTARARFTVAALRVVVERALASRARLAIGILLILTSDAWRPSRLFLHVLLPDAASTVWSVTTGWRGKACATALSARAGAENSRFRAPEREALRKRRPRHSFRRVRWCGTCTREPRMT